jgi:lipopolysaccharide transport system permease protein
VTGVKNALLDLFRSARFWRIWLRLGLQDVRNRFRRSLVGFGWIFVQLSVTILAVGFIYGNLLGQDMGFFIPYLTAGLVLWSYLTSSIIEGGSAFVNSEGYIKQISLPLYVYVFRSHFAITLVALISLLVFFMVAVLYSLPFKLGSLWFIPGVIILITTSFLLVLIFAHINARFRDAAHLASLGMQVFFYVTPIIFPADLLRDRGYSLVVVSNPFFHLLEVVRKPLLSGTSADGLNYVCAGVIVALLLALALMIIGRYQRRIVFSL